MKKPKRRTFGQEIRMAAHFVDIDVKDMDRMQEYLEAVPRTIQKYGGRWLVRAVEGIQA